MKRILTSLAVAGVFASTLSADFARVEMGGGLWTNTPSGTLSYEDSGATGLYTSNETSNGSIYAWILVKHPIPVLPNIRLEYTSVEDEGESTGSFNGFVAPLGSPSSLKITQYDVIPYYNILDNTFWMTIDLGVDIKMAQIDYAAEGVTVAGVASSSYEDTTSLAIPLGYARARVEIPATDIGFEADIKYISYNASTVSDFRIKVDYTLGFIPVVQPAIEIGYRAQKYDLISDDEKTKINLDFSGVYAGLMLRF